MTFTQFASLFHISDFIMANIVALICTLLLNRKRRLSRYEKLFSHEDIGQRYEYVVYCSDRTLHLYSEHHTHDMTLAAMCYAEGGAYKVEVRDRMVKKES